MKIFFTTPYLGKAQYQSFINTIISDIEKYGATIISPEINQQYLQAFSSQNLEKLGSKNRAHYEFIRQGIAGADAVIFEASYEDFRVGHEATLGLMYNKPVLVVSQHNDYSEYIAHEKLTGKKYTTTEELHTIITDFLNSLSGQLQNESYQVVGEVVDLEHSAVLSTHRYKALQGQSYFADWARRATVEPDLVYQEIITRLGNLPIQQPWDVFAKIYNEDTPDAVFYGAVKFADKIFRNYHVSKANPIVDVACGTGSVSRLLTSFGYRNIAAFDKSRAMLSEAYRLCSHLPSIKIQETSVDKFSLNPPANGIVWFDFSTNFALEETELSQWLQNLTNNLDSKGILLFDVRTKTGWSVDFFHQKVTIYETENFQRIWINLPNYELNRITFDIFIRVKNKSGEWLPWEREQMTERMWSLLEVKALVEQLPNASITNIYSDDFTTLNKNSNEPGLAYFVIQKD